MRIIFIGSGEFGIPSFEALLQAGHEIVLVVSQPDKGAGRGRQIKPTPIAQAAESRGIAVLKTADINSEKLPPADLSVVIAFGQKIGEHQVHHARLGMINLHGSRLPLFRGAGPIQAAIVSGETVSGNTIIRVTPRMDAGAMLGQSSVPIGELETAGELHDRLAADGAPLLVSVVQQLEKGSATETAQDDSIATKAPKLSRATAQIDWSAPASKVARLIRGLFPWPGCHVRLVEESGGECARLTLVRARVIEQQGMPGTILASGAIACGSGAIEIIDVQPEGKRQMSLAALRNGHPWKQGMRLEAI